MSRAGVRRGRSHPWIALWLALQVMGFEALAADETSPDGLVATATAEAPTPRLATAPADDALDSLLEQFDDSAPSPDPGDASRAEASAAPRPREEPEESAWYAISGSTTFSSSYNYARRDTENGTRVRLSPLSRLRAGLKLQLDLDLFDRVKARIAGRAYRDYAYARMDRSRFSRRVLEQNQSEAEFQELYLLFSPARGIDVKVGRQTVVLGFSDDFRVVDVLNPLDNREPGQIDLADLRRPVAMTRVDSYLGSWQATGVVVHESRFDEQPLPGSDFFPLQVPQAGEFRPANGGDDTEWAGHLKGVFSGFDVAFTAASTFADLTFLNPSTGLREHPRTRLVGASANVTRGSWLYKMDAAAVSGLRFSALPSTDFRRHDVVGGVEYAGFAGQAISLEIALRRLADFDPALRSAPDFVRRTSLSAALRYTGAFYNDRLIVSFLSIVRGASAKDGAFVRLSGEYALRSSVRLRLGLLAFQEGDVPPLSFLDENDRVFVDLIYSF